MADKPLGIIDLYNNLPPQPIVGGHWYWCRRHERAEPSGWAAKWDEARGDADGGCIRIGPFMSEREAERLTWKATPYGELEQSPLGMEVER